MGTRGSIGPKSEVLALRKMQAECRKDPRKVVSDIQKMIKEATENDLDPKECEEAAMYFAKSFYHVSRYRRSICTEALLEADDVTKIIVCRFIASHYMLDASIESILCRTSDRDILSEYNSETVRLTIKERLPYPMAFGVNIKRKLGTGLEPTLLKFQRVHLDGDVRKIYVGHAHSIFIMQDGRYYGAGLGKNFLENIEVNMFDKEEDKEKQEDDLDNNITIRSRPKLLEYMNDRKNKNLKDEPCELTESSTIFHEFKEGHDLIVGEKEECSRQWHLKKTPENPPVKNRTILSLYQPDTDDHIEITMNVEDHTFKSMKTGKHHKIQFFLFGKAVKLNESAVVHYCRKGVVWMTNDGALYRGMLKIAPEAPSKKSNQEKIVVVMLEEIALEYFVEKFAVSPDGSSIIVYSSPTDNEEDSCCTDPSLPEKMLNVPASNYHPSEHFEMVYASFRQMANSNLNAKLYQSTGIPTAFGEPLVALLQVFDKFTRNTYPSEMPDVIESTLSEISKDRDNSQEILDRHFNQFVKDTEKILPPKGFTFQPVSGILATLDYVVAKLRDLPLKYYQTDVIKNYKERLVSMMNNCLCFYHRRANPDWLDSYWKPYLYNEEIMKTIKTVVEERIRKGDIDATNPKFKFVRVQATQIKLSTRATERYEFFSDFPTTHIKIVNPDLLAHIDANNVLNLNKYAYEKHKDPKDINKLFDKLVDVFFKFSENKVPEYKFMDNIFDYFTKSELYEIEATDGIIHVPSYIIQLYSDGFDAARTRCTDSTEVTKIKMNATTYIIKQVIYALVDYRMAKKETCLNLYKMLELCQYCLFTDIQPKLMQFIVQNADERQHFELIQQLFITQTEQVIEAIVKYRQGLLVYWTRFPIPGNYLKTLEKIIEQIKDYEMQQDVWPLSCSVSKNSDLKIDPNWLQKEMLKDEDKDLEKDFKKTIIKWQGKTFVPPPNPIRVLTRKRARPTN